MAMMINNNTASINAQRHLNASRKELAIAMERLSSGQRINSAKDDAAGLAIRDKMTSQIEGLRQAVRNSNDAISLAQTAEGAMEEITNMLQRMRNLSVQAINDTNSSTDRQALNEEVVELKAEINRIANTSHKIPYVFVPIEYPELAEGEEIQPYQPGFICSEWLELELVEPPEHN